MSRGDDLIATAVMITNVRFGVWVRNIVAVYLRQGWEAGRRVHGLNASLVLDHEHHPSSKVLISRGQEEAI